MRLIFTAVLGFLIGQFAFATGQIPDYLIYKGDTVKIFSNPLEQYFNKTEKRELIDFVGCVSTACWRGYKAIWELKNDSLFLRQITSCHKKCGLELKNADLNKMFGTDNVFAGWYNGTLLIPRGKLFSGSEMGYSAIYEYEELLNIENGKCILIDFKNNLTLIEDIKQNQKKNIRISTLKDTSLFYLNQSMDWKKLDNSKNTWCDDSYILMYDKLGQLKDVKLNTNWNDSTSLNEKNNDSKMDKRCSSKIKKSLKAFSLAYIEPKESFLIQIDLNYDDKLEIHECSRYYDISNKEIEEWIKRQMNVE